MALRVIPPPPAPPPSSRAAVRPRSSTRPGAALPATPPAPVSSRAQYFRSLTQTREDWPLVPAGSTPPPPPTFGAPPASVVNNPRHSLPAFLPPSTMSERPPAARAANDQAALLRPAAPVSEAALTEAGAALDPMVIDEVVLPLQKTRLGGPWLFGLGVVAGALLTWIVQSL
ncbi:MAG: hypothetical protein IPM79_23150 [Polyangiaceae bacterium]|nr:hypothetical protein [Polyangiaceae bacterium]